MTRKLDIAIGSTCSVPGNVIGNLNQISAMADKAQANGCDLLLTPELSVTGYGGYDIVLACAERAGNGVIYQGLAQIAQRNKLVVLAGFVEQEGEQKYIAHYAVFPDGRFVAQRKHRVTPNESPLCPSVGLYYDETEDIGHVPEGSEKFLFFSIRGVRCAMVICADFGIRHLNRILHENRIELLLLPTAAGGCRESIVKDKDLETDAGIMKYYDAIRDACFPSVGFLDCIRCRRALVAVNMCGFDGTALYHGGSGFIISPHGVIEAMLPGILNLDRQKPMFACGQIIFE